MSAGWRPAFEISPYAKHLLRYYWPWLPVFLAGLYCQCKAKIGFPTLWFAAVMIPLMQVEAPYGRYLIPAFPAMALSCAFAIRCWIRPARRECIFRAGCAVLLAIAGIAMVFPAQERAVDMRTIAPVVARFAKPGQRVILYTDGTRASEFRNQLLWYGDHYIEHLTLPQDLVRGSRPGTVVVTDRAGLLAMQNEQLLLNILGYSKLFTCYTVQRGPLTPPVPDPFPVPAISRLERRNARDRRARLLPTSLAQCSASAGSALRPSFLPGDTHNWRSAA